MITTVPPDDDRPTLTISDASEDEGGTLHFTASLDKATEADVEVEFTLADVTTEGNPSDYGAMVVTYNAGANTLTAVAGKYTVPAGVTTLDIAIVAANDTIYEGDETFTLSAAVTDANITDTDTGTGTITDGGVSDGDDNDGTPDDDRPTLTIGDASEDEGGTLHFTASLDKATEADVEVEFTLADVTTEGNPSDYGAMVVTYNAGANTLTAVAGKYTVPAGVTTLDIAIVAANDTIYEGDETFTLSAAVTDANITDTDTGTGTITDGGVSDGDDNDGTPDDDRPTLTISDASEDEGGTLHFTASLDKATEADVEVEFTLADVTTEGNPSDYGAMVVTYNAGANTLTAVAGKYTVPAGVTTLDIAIVAANDTIYEGDETFTLSAAVTDANITDTDTGTGTITDGGVSDGDDNDGTPDDDRPTPNHRRCQ